MYAGDGAKAKLWFTVSAHLTNVQLDHPAELSSSLWSSASKRQQLNQKENYQADAHKEALDISQDKLGRCSYP